MADITVNNTRLTAMNRMQALTANAATESTAATAQKFVLKPTGKDNHAVLLVQVGSADGCTVGVAGGDAPFALPALTDAVGKAAGVYAFQVETGRYMKKNGTIEVTLTPPAGKALSTDLSAKVFLLEMLPN